MIEDLINLCKRGDKKAQRQLYEKFSGKLFRLCYRYFRHQMEAEDVMVNGFVKIFQNLDSLEYRSTESAEAWIKKIMVNDA